ncbi:MAG: nucleotide-binding universal stress UspA family protein [Salibacteraceae bacterium]|jgi:nucleotide-binding universal stress UspA family protein
MKVLIPTDFSASARSAFDYGYQLVKEFSGVEMILLNSYEMPKVGASGGIMINMVTAMGKESERDLSIELKHLKELYSDVTITSVSRYDSIENAISRIGKEEGIDFVVMGTHGASGLKKTLVGSNTQSVIENCDLPVISVPRDWKFRPMKNIVYITDLNRLENPEILKPICALAEAANATIHIVYVANEKAEIDLKKEMEELPLNQYFKEMSRKFSVIESRDVAEGIDSYVNEMDADLVVMIPKEATFWESLFTRSVIEQLAFQSKVPLLSLRDK